jgi:UDP-N-acetylmuramyl pentapeptide phosphotransferase/UDP-N-acetylglucosamine-1-phosphate transferase
MFGDLDKYIMVFLTGLLVTYLLTPVVRRMAVRFGVVDLPDARRPHKRPTARGGGLAVVVGVHAACLVAILFPWQQLVGALDFAWWQRFACASLLLLVVGVVDDIRGMKPLVKLAGQVAAALIMWFSGTRFGQLLGHDVPVPLDCVLVVVWLVAIINAFNLIDGLDGLASGLAIISAVGLCGIMVMQQVPGEVLLLVGFIGACLGFLRYNFNPASIFLGDTGSMFIGFTLGVISLQTFNKNTFVISMAIPVMVLGIPIYDAMLAIWRRSVRSWVGGGDPNGKHGIMQPDLEHLHHRLSRAGLSTKRVASTLYLLNGGLVAAGLTILFFNSHAAGIFLIALLAGVYVLMRHLAVIELRETGSALLMGLRRPTHSSFKALAYPVWDMMWLAGSLAFIMWFCEDQRPAFWYTWFMELPIWVTPTFSLLALSRAYVTCWPRARLRDALMVMFWLQSGNLLSLGLALVIDPQERYKWLLRAVLIMGLSHPVILISRLFYRCLEELVLWLKRQGDAAGETEHIVLYGAGVRAQLFLTDRATRTGKNSDGRQIVGFIDDEKSLHFQWVYGFRVLGGPQDLPRLIERWKINRVIIVCDLLPESRTSLQQIAIRSGINLSEWQPEEHPVSLVAACEGPALSETSTPTYYA